MLLNLLKNTDIIFAIFNYDMLYCGRCGGLMVSALVFGSSGLGLSPGRGHCVYFWARHLTLTVPLSTQVYKWVPASLMLGGSPTMDWHPIQGGGGGRNTPSRLMPQKLEL